MWPFVGLSSLYTAQKIALVLIANRGLGCGDPSSVEFCHKVGLDYVSCSPFRVPIARLAAAQAAIRDQH